MSFKRADGFPTPQALRDGRVVSGHLPPGYGYGGTFDDGAERTASSSTPELVQSSEESSLRLQGGDMHRDLFRTAARANKAKNHRRANTFHHYAALQDEEEESLIAVSNQLAPGGFRRAFIHQKRDGDFLAARMPVTRNFVEFLDLYGSFAGEDLADSDDEAITVDDESADDEETIRVPAPERRPLLRRRRSSRAGKAATAGTTKTFFTLLKAFIGTGIMFLPKAFSNGGLLFSSVTMVLVASVTMISFHLLLACKNKYSGGYGELGEAISGPRLRSLILASITLSQLGFVCAGIVFVAENLQAFVTAVSLNSDTMSATSLILIQLLVLVPLSFIRNIAKLGPVALLADIFIVIGLVYIYYFDFSSLAENGIHETVVMFNPDKYAMMIGSAIFTFEGIGLILPIQSSMAKPERFEYLLGAIMLLITIVFTSVGAFCYVTFGTDTQIEVIDNYPQDNKFVNAVQFLYAMAVLVGTPVQLFPALRILEGYIFGHHDTGKKSHSFRWIKNAFRTTLVLICGAISVAGAGNLDRFVALIGSFACVPLVYIYPPYLHYHGVADTWKSKLGDIVLMSVGIVCMVYTTAVTLAESFL